jgi:hypothetical protein
MDKRNESASLALGIDIGGSHITAGMVDWVQKKVIEGSVVRSIGKPACICRRNTGYMGRYNKRSIAKLSATHNNSRFCYAGPI